MRKASFFNNTQCMPIDKVFIYVLRFLLACSKLYDNLVCGEDFVCLVKHDRLPCKGMQAKLYICSTMQSHKHNFFFGTLENFTTISFVAKISFVFQKCSKNAKHCMQHARNFIRQISFVAKISFVAQTRSAEKDKEHINIATRYCSRAAGQKGMPA